MFYTLLLRKTSLKIDLKCIQIQSKRRKKVFSPHMNVFGVLTRIYLETTTASYASPTQIINAGEQLAITP